MNKWIINIISPIISTTILLISWYVIVDYLNIPPFILPSPSAVGLSLWQGLVWGTFYPDIAATTSAMLIGYVVGTSLALLLAITFVEFRFLEIILNPYVIAFQAVPKVAVAPLIVIWLGYGMSAKVTMVVSIVFFPVFVNAVVGMRATDPDRITLFDAFSASRLSKLVNLKIPSAASAIFAGLQVSIVFALIGTVVTEFIASRAGLGVLITTSMSSFDVATMFAALIVLSVLGVAFNGIVAIVRRRAVFWEGSTR